MPLPSMKDQFAALIAAPSVSCTQASLDQSNRPVIDLLADHGVAARRLDGAPGVYVERADREYAAHGVAKIASLGLRVRKAGCYHGVSLNVDMDLSPFDAINPCGYAGMAVTQTNDQGIDLSPAQLSDMLAIQLAHQLEKT